ncbi:MAG: hypothetical protein KDD73_13195 [Anaerolineales bacterium]|nr:hypothetical protein [Anaerolineales bacterium]
MPTYVYHCDICNDEFEAVQRFSDDDLRHCPAGHDGVRRIFTPAGIIFKGSGWYIKDSKASADGSAGKPRKSSATDNETTSAHSDKSSEKSSESPATEAATESKAASSAPTAETA